MTNVKTTWEVTIEKEEIPYVSSEPIQANTFILAFDVENNYHFVNFQSKESLKQYVEENGLFALYCSYIDYICSEVSVEEKEVTSYYIGEVIQHNEEQIVIVFEKEHYHIEEGPFLLTYSHVLNVGAVLGVFDKPYLAYQYRNEYCQQNNYEVSNFNIYPIRLNDKLNIII